MIIENDGPSVFNTTSTELNIEVEFNRKEIGYENKSAKFTCLKKDFKKQFAHIYSGRLMKMRERVVRSCSLKWGSDIPIRKLSELSDENNEKCIVIGTLFKHQELKPNILKEISEENQVMPQPVRSNYVSEDDVLILEDEVQRIRLIGELNVKKYVTGIVIGLLGFEGQDGKFEVEDICFASVESGPEKPLQVQDDCYLIIISGLNIGGMENLLALELLADWIKGDLGSIKDQENCSKVCRVLIAGNSVQGSHTSDDAKIVNTEIEEHLDTLAAVKELDELLLDLARSVEVDLMPGEFDPSNHILPQQPIYNCVFPKASQYQSFNPVTNPYECLLGGRRILGTSGQPINDIKTLTDISDSLEILESTLIWAHLAPTAPDTLGCYPYYQEDPFIITEQPDIYFAGNQPELNTKMVDLNGHRTRLISIPSFSKTQTCAVVNLKTLECTPLTFTV